MSVSVLFMSKAGEKKSVSLTGLEAHTADAAAVVFMPLSSL